MFIFWVPQGSANQHGSAISHVGSDHFPRQFRTFEMSEHGVDRVDQVQPRVNKGAVEIKDQQLDGVGIELPIELDHGKTFNRRARRGRRETGFRLLHVKYTSRSRRSMIDFLKRPDGKELEVKKVRAARTTRQQTGITNN